jgi:cobalamin biosynthesis Mg chelatase CobN
VPRITGVSHARPNREIRVSRRCQRSCGHPAGNDFTWRYSCRGRLPFRTERPGAKRQPLALSHRSRHQTSLLVSQGRKAFAKRCANSSTAETTTQRSIADAHAELPAQAAIEAPKRGDGLAPAADATIATPAPETQRSAVASRWPEQSGTSSSTASLSTAANSGVAAPPDSDAAPPAAPAAVALAAADSSPEKQPGSLQTLLLAILGALALAGLIGSAVFRFGNLRWIGRRTIQVDRQAIWETANIDRRSPTVDLDSGARIRRDEIPWELRTADDPNGRIEDMLARLARSATN